MSLILVSVLSIAVQAGLIVHAIKTGRNSLWIWAIALLPPAGPIAYVVVEILPDLLGGRAARRAKAGVQRMIDPDRDLRRASAEVEISGNVDARRRLAEELLERAQFARAIEAYEGGLRGRLRARSHAARRVWPRRSSRRTTSRPRATRSSGWRSTIRNSNRPRIPTP